jgi:hypothetical protein
VYAISPTSGQVDLRLNFSFNDRIVDIIKVPTAKISQAILKQHKTQDKKP